MATTDICIEFDDVVAGYGEFMILNNLSFEARAARSRCCSGPTARARARC